MVPCHPACNPVMCMLCTPSVGDCTSLLSSAVLPPPSNSSSIPPSLQGVVNIAELTRNPFAKTFAGLNCSVAKETSGVRSLCSLENTQHLCHTPVLTGCGVSPHPQQHDSSWRSYLTAALTECVLTEKLHLLPVYIQLEKVSSSRTSVHHLK